MLETNSSWKAIVGNLWKLPFKPVTKVEAVELSIKSNKVVALISNIRWICPQVGYFKLNCDGSVKLDTKKAIAGGV